MRDAFNISESSYYQVLGRVLGDFACSLIGFKRINHVEEYFVQRGLRAFPS